MDIAIVGYVIGISLMIEGGIMFAPLFVAACYGESVIPFVVPMVLSFAIGFLLSRRKPGTGDLLSKEGVVATALVWIILSLTGMLPFIISGSIKSPVDAFFETVSGFTTTGSSILTNVEALPKSCLLWRSLMHWIGGMGILVFMLALMPLSGGSQMNLMKAESPGPSISKLVPRAQDTAKILYGIYFLMTCIVIAVLLFTKMPLFDAVCIGMGAAGTGGFSVRNTGCADYTVLQQAIISLSMLVFGVNFNFYYFLFNKKQKKQAFRIEEVNWYILIMLAAAVLIAASLTVEGIYRNPFKAFHEAFFHCSSLMTTTGFATSDLNLWPGFAKALLTVLMLIGACAGSTAGGLKISRVLLLFKSFWRECGRILHPQAVRKVHMDGKTVDEQVVHSTAVYFFVYVLLMVVSAILLSFDGKSWETTVTAVIAAFNNIGPGFGEAGSMGNFSSFSIFSKLVLSADMLIGRLEIFPMVLLFTKNTWRKF